MKIQKVFLLVLFLLFTLGTVFYTKMLPYIVQANAFFILNNDALENTVRLFVEHKEIAVLKKKTIDGLIFKNNRDKDDIISNNELKSYGDIVSDSSISPIRRMPEKISFFIGSKRKFNKTFNISYDYFFDNNKINVTCDKDYKLQGYGVCTYLLDKNWVLRYEWISI